MRTKLFLLVAVVSACSDMPGDFDAGLHYVSTSTSGCVPMRGDINEWNAGDCVDLTTDCGGKWCDILPAIEKIRAAHFAVTGEEDVDPVIHIPSGEWLASDVIRCGKRCTFISLGHHLTTIHTSTTAIWCMSRAQAQDEGLGNGGQCRVKGLTLKSEEFGDLDHAGIRVNATAYIEDVYALRFVHGFRFSGDVNRPLASNANESVVIGTYASFSRHAGYYMKGGDASGMTFIAANGSNNCYEPDKWVGIYGHEDEDCLSFHDESFLGNTGIGLNHALSGPPGDVDRYTNYGFGLNANARSAYIGPYSENAQGFEGRLGPLAVAIGGSGKYAGQGLRFEGPITWGFRVINDLDFRNEPHETTTFFGRQINNGAYLWAGRHDGGRVLGFGYWPRDEAWRYTLSFFEPSAPFYIGGEHTSPLGLGGFKVLKPVD